MDSVSRMGKAAGKIIGRIRPTGTIKGIKQLAKVKPEKREQFEQRHSRELILYDAAVRYLNDLKDSGEGITPKAWQREIDQLAAGKQTDTLAMKSMREELKAVERLRKTAEQLSRQERDKSHDREPER